MSNIKKSAYYRIEAILGIFASEISSKELINEAWIKAIEVTTLIDFTAFMGREIKHPAIDVSSVSSTESDNIKKSVFLSVESELERFTHELEREGISPDGAWIEIEEIGALMGFEGLVGRKIHQPAAPAIVGAVNADDVNTLIDIKLAQNPPSARTDAEINALIDVKATLKASKVALDSVIAGNATQQAELDAVAASISGKVNQSVHDALVAGNATDAEVETIRAALQTQIDAVNTEISGKASQATVDALVAGNATDAELQVVASSVAGKVDQATYDALVAGNATDAELESVRLALQANIDAARDKGYYATKANLTALPINSLSTGDFAHVGTRIWVYQGSSGDDAGEFVLAPDDAGAATGRWVIEGDKENIRILQNITFQNVRSAGTNAGSSWTFSVTDLDGDVYPASAWAVSAVFTQYAGGSAVITYDKAITNGTLFIGRNKSAPSVIIEYVGQNPNGVSAITVSAANHASGGTVQTLNYDGTNFSELFKGDPINWTSYNAVEATDQGAPWVEDSAYPVGAILSHEEANPADPNTGEIFNWRVKTAITENEFSAWDDTNHATIQAKLDRFSTGAANIQIPRLIAVNFVQDDGQAIQGVGNPNERFLYVSNTTDQICQFDAAGANPAQITDQPSTQWANGALVEDLATGTTYKYLRATNKFEVATNVNANGIGYITLALAGHQTLTPNSQLTTWTEVGETLGMSTSSGGIDLKAGRTYKLSASLDIYSIAGVSSSVFNLGMHVIGSDDAQSIATFSGSKATYGGGVISKVIEVIYTPPTDQTIRIRLHSSGTNATSMSFVGNNTTFSASHI